MKKNYLLGAVMAAIMIIWAGCSKENIPGEEDSAGDLKVTTNIAVLKQVVPTRSVVTDFVDKTAGIYVDDEDGLYNPSTNSTITGTTDISNGSAVTPLPLISIDADAMVYAWYPATVNELTNPNSTSTKSITVVDADDFAASSQTDYFWATPTSVTSSKHNVALNFNHALSKVVFKITKGNLVGEGKLTGLTITSSNDSYKFLSGSGTMAIKDGSISGLTSVNALTYTGSEILSSDEATGVVALVAPVTLAESTSSVPEITINLTIDGDPNYSATLPVTKASSWEALTEYTYKIVVNRNKLKIDILKIIDWTEDSSSESDSHISVDITPTANCYMIVPDNSITIPVNVRGNGVYVAGTGLETSISPLSVGILWETSAGLISLGGLSSDKKVVVTAGSTSGNAVIAAYSGANQSGDILWSWHIWVTDYDPDNGTTFTVTNSASKEYVFMDRNLGATSATPGNSSTMGLQYQWGRKDPFTGSSSFTSTDEMTLYDAYGHGSTGIITVNSSTGMINIVQTTSEENLSNSIKNPMSYYCKGYGSSYDWYSTSNSLRNDALWGGEDRNTPSNKTIFDPCPAGWRVPAWNGSSWYKSASPWSAFTESDFTWLDTDYGRTYDGSFYPASGYRDNLWGKIKNVGIQGYYWSGSVDDKKVYSMFFESKVYSYNYPVFRADGLPVRCVRE